MAYINGDVLGFGSFDGEEDFPYPSEVSLGTCAEADWDDAAIESRFAQMTG